MKKRKPNLITAVALVFAWSLGAQETTPKAAALRRTVDTSRSSMPAYQRTAEPRSQAPGNHPTGVSDCAKEAWRNFRNPAFQSQQACESWVQKRDSQKNPPASAAPPRTPAAR